MSIMTISASTVAQQTKLRLNVSNATILEVFEKIEQQSDFGFVFKASELNLGRRYSIDKTGVTLPEVLDEIFSNGEVNYRIIDNSVIILKNKSSRGIIQQQTQTVNGKVTDMKGEPIPGVNVYEKDNPQHGVITGVDGSYMIEVTSSENVLVFSFIGFESQEINVAGRSVIDIFLMEESTGLDEVVVTALGIKKQTKALGYSVTEVKGDDLNTAKEANVLNSLSGKVAGVQINTTANGIGASSRVVIRGNSSFGGNNQPLYVIDGIPIRSSSSDVAYGDEYTGDAGADAGNDHAANINPEDIASVSVLKGPSAAALYGSRAANGVIVITTKSGTSKQGLGVTINSNTMFEQAYLFPRYQNVYGAGRGGAISGKRWNLDPELAYADDNGIEINRLGDDKSWGAQMNGQTYRQWDSYYTIGKYSPNPDFAKDFYRTGITTSNSISVDGGNDKTTARLSLTHLGNKGIVPTSEQDRTTVTLRATSKIAEKLTLDGRFTYVNQKVHNRTISAGRESIPWILNMLPRSISNTFLEDDTNPAYDPNTWPPEGINDYVISQERRDPANPAYRGYWDPLGAKAPWVGNPYWLLNNHTNDDERHNYTGFVSLKYDIIEGLSAMVRVGLDQSSVFTNYKYKSKGSSSYEGHYSEKTQFHSDLNADFLLSYNKQITEALSLAANFGGNHYQSTYRKTDVTASRFIIPDFFAFNNFNDISYGNLEKSEKEVNSFYFAGQVGYKNVAFVDFTGRNDWSSTLPADNRSFFYPSIAGSFVFSDAFDIKNEIFSFGKVRASWAQVGNGTDPYRLVPGIDTGRFGSLLTIGLDGTIPLSNLKPEITTSVEVGTDLRFFSNRLGLDFTWYKSNTVNQIVPVGVSPSTGFAKRIVNAGDIENRGIELLLSITPIERSNFTWDASINFTKNTSEVKEVLSDEDVNFVNIGSVNLSGGNGIEFRAEKGQPYGVIYGRKFKRNSEGLVVVDAKGIPLATDQVFIGDANPDWMAGVRNSFRYKGFTLDCLIDIRKGGIIINNTARTMARAGTHQSSIAGREDFYNSPEFLALTSGSARSSLPGSMHGGINTWINNNAVVQDDNLPKDANGNQIGGDINGYYANPRIYHEKVFKSGIVEPFVEDASYVKLRELSLSYSIPKSALKKLPFKGASIGFVGRNLFIFHRNTKDFDPESNVSSGNGQGLEGNSLPGTRRYGFNIKLEL
ncbi:MAG: SusC/RagA family TonB-linked outer membrane protein [Marinilabiliaceae bacterium]|nr:SusC/RagA family TonB-linked outer membrane protein [Marinilabiliaceae bacterium]